MLRRDAATRVGHGDAYERTVRGARERNATTGLRELDAVGHQVQDDLLQLLRIGAHHERGVAVLVVK